MTATERGQIQRIATAIGRGDYTCLENGGEHLVFAIARDLSVAPADLCRMWASGSVEPSARRTRVVVEIDDDDDDAPVDSDDAEETDCSDDDDSDADEEMEHRDDEDEDDDIDE